jgi:hypothetical protein
MLFLVFVSDLNSSLQFSPFFRCGYSYDASFLYRPMLLLQIGAKHIHNILVSTLSGDSKWRLRWSITDDPRVGIRPMFQKKPHHFDLA